MTSAAAKKKSLGEKSSSSKHSVHKVHPDFELLQTRQIDSLNICVEEYRHKATGASHFHLASDNTENVFLVAFRTVPMDSTGVAHILEHTALCGSEKFPVRDPFFMMIRRSLNTFMNAFTSSDWTAYPFASQNRKDFFNLLDVYLDATFFSRLHELDFSQEGHRVEFEKQDDADTNLVFKGVVFNEMKGAMSATTSKLWQVFTEHLFPTTTYHYNSGGEPSDIPELGYRQLKTFYKSHYHPSNAIFMTYGDIPAFELQTRFQDNALSRFQKLDIDVKVNDEKRFTSALSVTKSYALDEADAEGNKTHIVVGWLLGKCTDPLELMRAHLLSSVLLDNGASPLRYALETSDLGSAPSPLCGLEDSNREMALMCGLEGSTAENTKAVEKLVMEVLKDVAENGVSHEKLASVLHQLELQQREVSGDGYPYGLQLILEALPAAIHDGDPVDLLDLDKVLTQLQSDITDPEFIKNLVRDWLLENPHRLRLTLVPDTDLSDKENVTEAAKLAKMKAAMSDSDKQNVIDLATALAKRQQEEDDPEVLPKVNLSDVPNDLLIPVGDEKTIGDFPAACYAQGTNGLVYEQIIIDLPQLDDELVQLLPVYTNCLAELGIGEKDYLYTQDWQDAVSGGISASTTMRGAINDEQVLGAYFTLSGRALIRNQDKLADLMQQMIETVRFDESARIREVIAQMRARSEQSVTGSGHMLAMSAASSRMSPGAALSHRLRGLQGIHSLKKLDDSLDDKNKLAELQEKFQVIHQKILQSPRQFLIIGEAAKTGGVIKTLDNMWRDRKSNGGGMPAFSTTKIRDQVKQGWMTSTRVNFCAKAYPTVPVNHPDAAPLSVLSGFLRNGYLHRVIREQGGAYGGGAGHDTDNACFRFYSYRDPRLGQTLDDFDASIEWLLNEKHQWRQVEEAILGVIGAIDKPASPSGEARKAFYSNLFGRTPEQRRSFRNQVLNVKLDDLLRVGKKYLQVKNASVAVITNSAQADQMKELGLASFVL